MAIYLVISFFLLALIGMPIAIAFCFSGVIALFLSDQMSLLNVIVQRLTNGMTQYILIAVPFFILAGQLMNSSKITEKIFKFADTLVGHIPGGLGHSNVLASIIFAGMSGAAVADAGGLGAIEIKVMKEKGYDMGFRDAITVASSTIGPIIPPSVPMVIYGTMAQASTGALFLGGLIPGLLMGFSLMILVYFISKKRDYYVGSRANFNEIWISFKDAFLSLLTPIIIVGGIIFGIFTPTEAAVVASAYALILGTLVYRTLSWDNIKEVIFNTIITSSTIILIIAFASPFSWLLASDGASKRIMELVFSISTNPIIILLILNIFFLIIGMFLEAISVMVIVIPVLLPLVKILGIDPVHFGVVMVLNLMIGLATPPFGLSLFTIAKLEKIEPYKIYKPCLLFSIPLIIVLLLITYVPGLVLWLPRLLSLG